MNMAANATVVMPLVFAVWTLIQYWIAAIRSQGLGHYLRHELFTPGVPWPVYFLLAPINLLELLIIRPASLTIRLFANIGFRPPYGPPPAWRSHSSGWLTRSTSCRASRWVRCGSPVVSP